MKQPTIVERFADNGEHSHYALIETETGELLWSEAPEEEIQQVKNLNIPDVSNCYMADCLIQDSCFRFKQQGCNKDCKLYI